MVSIHKEKLWFCYITMTGWSCEIHPQSTSVHGWSMGWSCEIHPQSTSVHGWSIGWSCEIHPQSTRVHGWSMGWSCEIHPQSTRVHGWSMGWSCEIHPQSTSVLFLVFALQVWVNAAAQTFNSLGVAFGGLITMSSYSKFNNKILRYLITTSWAVSFVLCIKVVIYFQLRSVCSGEGVWQAGVYADRANILLYGSVIIAIRILRR